MREHHPRFLLPPPSRTSRSGTARAARRPSCAKLRWEDPGGRSGHAHARGPAVQRLINSSLIPGEEKPRLESSVSRECRRRRRCPTHTSLSSAAGVARMSPRRSLSIKRGRNVRKIVVCSPGCDRNGASAICSPYSSRARAGPRRSLHTVATRPPFPRGTSKHGLDDPRARRRFRDAGPRCGPAPPRSHRHR